MKIIFRDQKYKSIMPFEWDNIPNFVVITGTNGSGKSQLLELIYNTIINKSSTKERLIIDEHISPNEITFLKGEWHLQDTNHIDLSLIQQNLNSLFNNLQSNVGDKTISEHNVRKITLYQDILSKTGKSHTAQITKEEFDKHIPELFIEHEQQLSQKIAEIFYNYRLSEIDRKAEGLSSNEIMKELGEKPWVILREIFKESKLPFEVNDPSNNRIKEGFHLRLKNTISGEEIKFSDLSSGEKVLISLMFYLYNSQEKNIFPKMLLLDEPDAHLHPSMSQQFINVVKNVLVDKYNVKVIMTTHSPSTVMLSPIDSIFEMSRSEPRIKKSTSKNHAVSLLTSGLVYVGESTRYFLVEDNDDVNFYSYIYNQLTTENQIDSEIPLVFIPASTKDKSGGKDVVQNWVNKLQDSGLTQIIQGLIDADSGNTVSDGVYKIDRYSIENYLADPILVFATLIDKEKAPIIDGINLQIGEEYKLKSLSDISLQKIVNKILVLVKPKIIEVFDDYNASEDKLVTIEYNSGHQIQLPEWLLYRRGKSIINEVYNDVFTSPVINFKTLFKSMRKLNMFPKDIIDKLTAIKDYR